MEEALQIEPLDSHLQPSLDPLGPTTNIFCFCGGQKTQTQTWHLWGVPSHTPAMYTRMKIEMISPSTWFKV
jgi:hypothetical protein